MARLPETPVTAAGCNVRYRSETLPDTTVESLSPRLDEQLSDAAYRIEGRVLKRAIKFDKGLVNLSVTVPDEEPAEIEFNFHLGSSEKEDLRAWLSVPIDNMRETISTLTTEILGLDIGCGEADGNDQNK